LGKLRSSSGCFAAAEFFGSTESRPTGFSSVAGKPTPLHTKRKEHATIKTLRALLVENFDAC